MEAAAQHEHYFGTQWHYDNENHWIECDCSEKSEVSGHTFYNEGKCVICGFETTEKTSEGGNNKTVMIVIIVVSVIGVLVVAGGVGVFVMKKIKNKETLETAELIVETSETQEEDKNAEEMHSSQTDI
jgi:hypothetical protein